MTRGKFTREQQLYLTHIKLWVKAANESMTEKFKQKHYGCQYVRNELAPLLQKVVNGIEHMEKSVHYDD